MAIYLIWSLSSTLEFLESRETAMPQFLDNGVVNKRDANHFSRRHRRKN